MRLLIFQSIFDFQVRFSARILISMQIRLASPPWHVPSMCRDTSDRPAVEQPPASLICETDKQPSDRCPAHAAQLPVWTGQRHTRCDSGMIQRQKTKEGKSTSRWADPEAWTAKIIFALKSHYSLLLPWLHTLKLLCVCILMETFGSLLHLLHTQAGFREQVWITVEERRICSHPEFSAGRCRTHAGEPPLSSWIRSF